jgi:hypothetical protein
LTSRRDYIFTTFSFLKRQSKISLANAEEEFINLSLVEALIKISRARSAFQIEQPLPSSS